MNYKKTGLLLLLMALVLVYGIAIGRYEVFPFNHLTDLKNLDLNILEEELPYGDVSIHDTSLLRLLVKNIKVEEDHSDDLFIRGGAIASIDNFLYISTNRNDADKGRLIVFDVENHQRMDTGGLSVPMNVEELLESPIMDIDGFSFERFQILGIYVENAGENKHTLFISHNIYHPDERCISFSISRTSIEITADGFRQTAGWNTLFTAEPCLYPEVDKEGYEPYSGQMSGGPMVEYDEEHLLVSVGSFHRDGVKWESLPMDTSSSFGKILRMNKQSGEISIYAEGLRNSQGLTIDSNGRIWATDHGPQGGDELNLIIEGNNYGWPEVSYGINYGNSAWPISMEQGRHTHFDKPVFAWMPAIATTDIVEVKGEEKFNLWKGDLIVGSFRNRIYRLRIEDDNRVIYSEDINIRHRIRDMTTLSDGKIAIITDSGLLIIVDDGGPVYEEIGSVVEARIDELQKFDQLQGGITDVEQSTGERSAQSIYMQKCSGCHYLQEVNGVGPHLNDIFNRRVGEVEGFNYSSTLSDKNERWFPELMRSFLLNPSDDFSNTSMQQVPLTEEEADMLIEFLSRN